MEAARKKAEDEKARVAEQERIRVQEAERSQKLKAELERKKAERETVVAQAYKSQTDRMQKEQAAAKAKVSTVFVDWQSFVADKSRLRRMKRIGNEKWLLLSINLLLNPPRSPSHLPIPAERHSGLLPV